MDKNELNVMVNCKNLNKPLLQVILEKNIEIEESNPLDCTLTLAITKCLQLMSKTLINLPQLLTKNLLNKLLTYIWIHLEHYADSVRHLTTNILINIVAIGKYDSKTFIFETIIEEICKMLDDKRAKHIGLNTLIGYVPIDDLLAKWPTMISTMLKTAQNSPSIDQVATSFKSIMRQHLKEISSEEKWLELWINPLLHAINEKPSVAMEYILIDAIKFNPKVIHYILSLESHVDDGNFKTVNTNMLICLRTSRKYGLSNCIEENGKWKGLVSYDLLRRFISQADVEIRMSSFSLLVECQKTTENFNDLELALFKTIFICNINNQCPAIRQRTLALTKKFLSRFSDSYQALQRNLIKFKSINSTENKDNITTNETAISCYNEFKQWILNFLFENIFPGANFSRRGTSLNILMLCYEYSFWDSQIFTEKNSKKLLICLLDPYEENKLLAKTLLSFLPLEVILYQDNNYVNGYLKGAIEMASSIRPADSISAAYFIALLTSFPQLTDCIHESCSKVDSGELNLPRDIPDLIAFICLNAVLTQLRKELDIAKESILKSASSAPMYGQICVIKNILQGLQFRNLVNNLNWKSIINDIINIAFKCNEVVACVVNNSSPEGHLPEDFNYGGSTSEVPVTSQVVLLCSWRTVKEVSLLLGEIVEKTLSCEETTFLPEEEILKIGQHLMVLLLETKHRGAFEQAYLGFCKLASSLWRCSSKNLHELPEQWLNNTLNEISTNSNLSATRRSAGIPFIVQGLICSELKVGSSNCLEKTFKTLFEILNCSISSTDSRVHALNILRALFRHNMLAELVGPYVAQALIVALNEFNSKTWPERNASTLLLSALMVRIFGVVRSRSEELNWKNKLTGRIFFQRYPSLYSELMKHLELATCDNLYPAIYPVLIILGRLYPSPLDGTDSNLQLNTFIPLVSKCATSSVLKTRSLAAKAMLALVPSYSIVGYINEALEEAIKTHSENRVHGLLLQVIKLIQNVSNISEKYLLELNLDINKWLSEIITFLLSDNKHSYLVKESGLKIIINCLIYFKSYVTEQNLKDIIRVLKKDLLKDRTNEDDSMLEKIGLNGYLIHAAVTLFITISIQKSQKELLIILAKSIEHELYEVFITTLDFMSFILNNSAYDPQLTEISPITIIDVDFINNFKQLLINNISINNILQNKIRTCNHIEDLTRLLVIGKNIPLIYKNSLKENKSVIRFFADLCEERHEGLVTQVLQWITQYLKGNNSELVKNDADTLCSLLKRYSTEENDYECRYEVACFLKNNFDYLTNNLSKINILTIWSCYLNLLFDDEETIRDLIYNVLSMECIPSEILKNSLERFLDDKRISNLYKAAGLLSWIIGNFSSEEEIWIENDRVFDKGDCNTFKEELEISRVIEPYLKKLLQRDNSILTNNLPEELASWIANECCLKQVYKTLQEVIYCFKNGINELFNRNNVITPFRSMEIKLLILEQKLLLLQSF